MTGTLTYSVAETLRIARQMARIRQSDLARTIRVSRAFLNNIEQGRGRLPEDRLALLPDSIRPAVVDAFIRELKAKELSLRPLLTVPLRPEDLVRAAE